MSIEIKSANSGGSSLSVGTLDSTSPSSDGAVIATGELILQSASDSEPGLINTTDQTIAGNKTLDGNLIVNTNIPGTPSVTISDLKGGNDTSLLIKSLSTSCSPIQITDTVSADANIFSANNNSGGPVLGPYYIRIGDNAAGSEISIDQNGNFSGNLNVSGTAEIQSTLRLDANVTTPNTVDLGTLVAPFGTLYLNTNNGGGGGLQTNLGRFDGDNSGDVNFSRNLKYDGANWRYIVNGTAQIMQFANNAGLTYYDIPAGNAGDVAPITGSQLDATIGPNGSKFRNFNGALNGQTNDSGDGGLVINLAHFDGDNGGDLNISQNLYNNGSGYVYQTTAPGSIIQLETSGALTFYSVGSGTAGSGATLNASTQILKINPTSTSLKNNLVVKGHISSDQTSAPTTTTSANAGTSASSSVSSNSTDSVGTLTLTTGSAIFSSGVQTTVNFSTVYDSPPIVVFSAANAAAATNSVLLGEYVTSSVSGFSINFSSAASGAATLIWNYHVIEAI